MGGGYCMVGHPPLHHSAAVPGAGIRLGYPGFTVAPFPVHPAGGASGIVPVGAVRSAAGLPYGRLPAGQTDSVSSGHCLPDHTHRRTFACYGHVVRL
ncbi:hypothetical protein D3C75_1115450 [compost metagenome]